MKPVAPTIHARGAFAGSVLMRFIMASSLISLLWLLYLFNPSHRWEEGFGLVPLEHIAWLPATTMPDATKATGVVMFTGICLAGIGLVLSGRVLRAVYLMALLAGVAMAIWVLIDRLTPRPFPVFPVTGIFTSENHYAAFANLMLPVALGLGWHASQSARTQGRVASAAPIFLLGALIIAASVMISGSRAGLAIACLIFVAFGWLVIRQSIWWTVVSERVSMRYIRMASAAALLAMLGVAAFYATRIGGELSFRGTIIQDSLTMWRDRPWWGVGPGAYSQVMPYYQSETLGDRVVLHAHNEYVQFLTEYGVLGSATLLGAFALVMIPSLRRATWTPEFSVAAVALGGCSLHALVDFTFRNDVIALIAFTCVGIIAGQAARGALAA